MAHGKPCTIYIGWCAFQKSNIFKNHQNRSVPRQLRVSSDSTENTHQSNGYWHAKLFGGNLQHLCHRLQHGPTVVVVQRHSQMDGGVVQHSAEAWQRDEESHLTWNPGELEGVLHSPGGKFPTGKGSNCPPLGGCYKPLMGGSNPEKGVFHPKGLLV